MDPELDVAVVGYGPVGQVVAGMLGRPPDGDYAEPPARPNPSKRVMTAHQPHLDPGPIEKRWHTKEN
ncbi:MAG: hypothetical protein M3N43_05625 [Actinomycetota bacterium]|nr:hypothetical protein [Actinomycetota bacterium]